MEISGLTFRKPQFNPISVEALALFRCFYPHRENNTLTKLISLIFVSGWVVITIGLTFTDLSTVRPVYYGVYTAVVFLIVGRIWDIEVDTILDNLR